MNVNKITGPLPALVGGRIREVGPFTLRPARMIAPGDVLADGTRVIAQRSTFTGYRITLAGGSWIDAANNDSIKIMTQTRAAAMLRHPAGKRRA